MTLQRLYSQLCKTEDGAPFGNTKNTRDRFYKGEEADEEEAKQKYQQMMEEDFQDSRSNDSFNSVEVAAA